MSAFMRGVLLLPVVLGGLPGCTDFVQELEGFYQRGSAPPVSEPSRLLFFSDFSQSQYLPGPRTVSLQVTANAPLHFSWETSCGALSSTHSTHTTSAAIWVADPPCNPEIVTPTVTVTASNGREAVSHTFYIFDFPSPARPFRSSSMLTPRRDHRATQLLSGKVLEIGGVSEGGMMTATTEVYDPATNTWSRAASMSARRYAHEATLLLSGKVLVTGGIVYTSGLSASTALYDPVTGTWSAGPSMKAPRAYHQATLLPSGKVLVTGGNAYGSSQGCVASAEIYDPATNTWALAAEMTSPRCVHTATLLLSGKVLVTGGESPWGTLALAEVYDPAANTWTTVGRMKIERMGHTAVLLLPSGQVLVTGGYAWSSSSPLTEAEVYDPESGFWSPTASMAIPRASHTMTAVPSGKVLVFGGQGAQSTLGIAEVYDPIKKAWSQYYATPRYAHTATLLPSGEVLISGGYSSGNLLAFSELYDPENR